MLYNHSPPLLSQSSFLPTTSLCLTHATFESKIPSKPLIRKVSGEIVKPILKRMDNNKRNKFKSVQFNNKELTSVKRFDKTLCPQSITGKIPLSIKPVNFQLNILKDYLMVQLENIELSKCGNNIIGLINVVNLAYRKEVILRYTFDNWTSFSHVDTQHYKSLNKNHKDIFRFELNIPEDKLNSDDIDQEYNLKFAIQYNVNNNEYWDNNEGKNYTILIKPNVFIKEEPKPKFSSRYCINNSLNEEIGNRFARSIPKAKYKEPEFISPSISIHESFFASPNISINNTASILSSSPLQISCSPVYGMGWPKAASSWFDSITINSFGHSPPVSFTSSS